jgi:integrase/recombinase XerD
VTHLRQTMLEELQRRNYATTTVYYYLKAVEQFAKYFHTSPDQLNQSHLRTYQAYLLRERKLGPRTVKLHVSALRFFFVKTLKRPYLLEDIPFPKVPRRLPVILTTEEVVRLIDGAKNLTDRTMLMVLYSTGMRNAELRHLQVRDIDSRRMLTHIQHGKGGRDRYVPLSARLLETLRVYYRWMRPKTWLFPGTIQNWRADKPITPKVVWEACRQAATRAQLEKRVSPHLLRHSYASHLVEAGADLRTVQLLLGHVKLEHTVIYLHLSQRHLQAVANPLGAMPVSGTDTDRAPEGRGGGEASIDTSARTRLRLSMSVSATPTPPIICFAREPTDARTAWRGSGSNPGSIRSVPTRVTGGSCARSSLRRTRNILQLSRHHGCSCERFFPLTGLRPERR